MRKFISGFRKHVKKECKATILIFDIYISRLMVYSKKVEKDNRSDKEKYQNKRAKSVEHESNQQRSGNGNTSFFHKKSSIYAQSSASALALSNINDHMF